MHWFIFIAALMAATAATAVVYPLLRHGAGRAVPLAAAMGIFASSAVLYALWSTWDWTGQKQQVEAQGPDVSAMVASLEQRLAARPDDLSGWLMLGRSYIALERFDQAVDAYSHALSLDGGNVEAQLGKGESLSLQASGQITADAAQLFEQAVVAEPGNPKALLFGGFAALIHGDQKLARTRWTRLKALNPPPQIARMLDLRLASLEAGEGPSAAPGNASGDTADGGLPPEKVDIAVSVRLAPALRSKLPAGALLFLFAREPDTPGPPLAVKKLSAAAFGQTVHLSSSDAMIPSRVLRIGQKVLVSARVSASGTPTSSPGDLFGQVPYDVRKSGTVEVLIDKVME